ncbi:MAG: nitroreductase family protein [Kiritimatiellae bacterium]|nr:nitroreductase family protein [Kiritimatiellia bacterium]
MDLFEAIDKRHSYRGGFLDAPVSRKDLQRIVQAGIQAPSGCNAQTTSFVIIDDPDIIAQIAEILSKPFAAEAKAMIVCVAHHKKVYQDMSFAVEDCAAAVENILLAITALGYATVWLDGVLRVEKRAEKIAELLNVPGNQQVRIILPIGVPVAKGVPAEKEPFNKRVVFNRYG